MTSRRRSSSSMSSIDSSSEKKVNEAIKIIGLGVIGGIVGTIIMSIVDIVLVNLFLPFEYYITDFAFDFTNTILPDVFPRNNATKGLLHLSIGVLYGLAIGLFFVFFFERWGEKELSLSTFLIVGVAWGLITQIVSLTLVLILNLASLDAYIDAFGLVQFIDHLVFGIVTVSFQAAPKIFQK